VKMFLIVYCDAADQDVIEAFTRSGVKAYTKLQEVRGVGTDTEPKLGTQCWPGKNNVLIIAAEEVQVPLIREVIAYLRKEHPRSGIKGFILPMEDEV